MRPADKFCACPSDNASTESNTIPSIWRKRRSWFRSHPAPVATKPTAPPLKISFPPGAISTWSISWEGPRECVSSTIKVNRCPHHRSRPSPRLTAVFRSVAGTHSSFCPPISTHPRATALTPPPARPFAPPCSRLRRSRSRMRRWSATSPLRRTARAFR